MVIFITKDQEATRIIEAFVESETNEGTFYRVTLNGTWKCTCPAGKFKGNCKHIEKVKEEIE